jgi:dTDP-4-amino-4,6-dideoxygalactose transaminase
MKVDFLQPGIRNEDILRAIKSLRSGWLVPDKYTLEFEKKLGQYLRGEAVMTSSCTAALHIALIMAGVGKGDEVITTPLSWVATANVILYQGAKPVFVDVDPRTGLIDIEKIHITQKTKAVIPVHLYGQMVDMRALRRKVGKVCIIEDAAHALEAERDGICPGEKGIACFSFHAAKNITCGNGGAIVSPDSEYATLLRRHGVVNRDGKRVQMELGYKYESTDFQAALLIGQLKRIEETRMARRKVFNRYRDAFEGMIDFPDEVPGTHACHMFVIWVDPKRRDKIRQKLYEKGIQTSIHYEPIHLEPYYREMGFKAGMFPIAEKLGSSTITLPTYALSKTKQDYVIKEVLCALR